MAAVKVLPAWTQRDWLALALVTAGAAVLRLAGLTTPAGLVFDEIFYARNACQFVLAGAQCGIDDLVSGAHPPLGNWLIGIGIKLFGFDEFGWRVASAVAGTLSVALLYLLVPRLLLAGQASPRRLPCWPPTSCTSSSLGSRCSTRS